MSLQHKRYLDRILKGEVGEGDTILVDYIEGDQLILNIAKKSVSE